MVTITTLGYGDYVPTTAVGYLVAATCSIFGILFMALPILVIVNNFIRFYSHAKARRILHESLLVEKYLPDTAMALRLQEGTAHVKKAISSQSNDNSLGGKSFGFNMNYSMTRIWSIKQQW